MYKLKWRSNGSFELIKGDDNAKLVEVNNSNTTVESKPSQISNPTAEKKVEDDMKEPESLNNLDMIWQKFLKEIAKEKPSVSSNLAHGYIVSLNETELIIGYDEEKKWHYDFVNKPVNIKIIISEAKTFFNNNINVKIILENGSKKKSIIEKKNNIENFITRKTKKEAMENPVFKKIIEEFNGKIKDFEVYVNMKNQEE